MPRGRLPGSKNPPKTPRGEALYIVRAMLDAYAQQNTEVSYQKVLSALAFMHELVPRSYIPEPPTSPNLKQVVR